MNAKNNGGPAFPFPTHDSNGISGQFAHSGMTLRDWFAGMAMQGIFAGLAGEKDADPSGLEVHVARAGYLMADAMLLERDK